MVRGAQHPTGVWRRTAAPDGKHEPGTNHPSNQGLKGCHDAQRALWDTTVLTQNPGAPPGEGGQLSSERAAHAVWGPSSPHWGKEGRLASLTRDSGATHWGDWECARLKQMGQARTMELSKQLKQAAL